MRFPLFLSNPAVAALIFLLTLCGCTRTGIQTQNHIPDELLGYWKTDAPRYEGHFLKLEKDFVIIGAEKDDVATVRRVTRVQIERSGGTTAYTISSINTDGADLLSLDFDPASGGLIRIHHMGDISWKREEPPPDF